MTEVLGAIDITSKSIIMQELPGIELVTMEYNSN